MPAVPPVIALPWRKRNWWLLIGLGAGVGVVAMIFFFNPAQHGFFPRCFFRVATGWDCPGCGGLRATHQLLHGEVRAAFALNPLLVLALPLAAYFAARSLVGRYSGKTLPQPFQGVKWLWLAAAAVVGFGVLRNVPWRQWLGL